MWTEWMGRHPKPGVKVLYKHPHLRVSDDFPPIKMPPTYLLLTPNTIDFNAGKFLIDSS